MTTIEKTVGELVFEVAEENTSVAYRISSDVRLVDRVVPHACNFVERSGAVCCGGLKLVLRELLLNAIEHGNHSDPALTVACTIELLNKHAGKIVVEDEGDGFDFESETMLLPDDPQQIRRRGLALVNNFADEILFDNNGSRVTVVLRVAPATTFDVQVNDRGHMIRPSGRITAAVANDFRLLLLDLVDQACNQFCFDLTDVEDIDSVSLSVFFVLAKTLADAGRDAQLEIVNANPSLTMLFQMTRLDRCYRVNTK